MGNPKRQSQQTCSTMEQSSTVVDVDRQWLRNLLQKYSNDVRLQEHHAARVEKYPFLQNKALVLAPMVDQSDLPFRLLCRNYGVNLCFTPMIHAKMLASNPGYRKRFWNPPASGVSSQDRPLIVQLCGSDKVSLEEAVRFILSTSTSSSQAVEAFPIDGIDINCGCPQNIAKRGQYGAYLLEQEHVLVDLVRHLAETFHPLPISVKVRLLPSGVDDSIKLYTKLVDAGAAMLTIHGRNRFQKGPLTGPADWDAIRRVVELLGHRIPILANGGIYNLDTANLCLQQTGADGVMSSEAILEYPPIFTLTNNIFSQEKRTGPGRLMLVKEYLDLCKKYPPEVNGQGSGLKCIRAHLFKLLHKDCQDYIEIRDHLAKSPTLDTISTVCSKLEELYQRKEHSVHDETLCWYFRYWGKNDPALVEKRRRNDPQDAEIECCKQNKRIELNDLDSDEYVEYCDE